MKIPETSANIGAYYGNEENGQWQPNGVIIDSGVGGGVVGSGDAGLHRPMYPVHMPRPHIAGYVMAGAYYPPGAAVNAAGAGAAGFAPPQDDFADYMWMEHEEEFDKQCIIQLGAAANAAGTGNSGAGSNAQQDDFADYMWMENEEDFDKQVMQQLEEEALMEQCIEAMLEDEQRERRQPTANGHKHAYPTTSNGASLSLEETVSRSTLNPLAAEFVPTRRPANEDKTEAPTESSAPPEAPTEPPKPVTEAPSVDDSKTEEPQPLPEPPEVSAADIQPLDKTKKDKKPEQKKQDTKKPAKQDLKKPKPQTTKSDTKVAPKKKEVKPVKSEARVSDCSPAPAAACAPAPAAPVTEDAPAPTPAPAPVAVEAPKPSLPTPIEEPTGPKPINYAAAAKANKPKKPTTPPVEKTPPPMEKPKLKPERSTPKSEKTSAAKDKPSLRKNSTK